MAKGKIKILLVEDQDIMRLGLKLSLDQISEYEVIGEAKDGPSAVSLAAQLKPDVILMDVGLPGMDGIAAAAAIKRDTPKMHILMLTLDEREDDVRRALAVGVNGYCLKETSVEGLYAAINSVVHGALWLDPRVVGAVLANKAAISQQAVAPSVVVGHMIPEPPPVIQPLGESHTKYMLPLIHDLMERFNESEPLSLSCRSEESSEFFADQRVGTIFADRYEIHSVLGRSAMSVVYKAKHKFMGTWVSVKTLGTRVSSPNHLRRFRQEAELANSLRHPNLLGVNDFGITDEGIAYLVMDYLDGCSLENVINKIGHIEADRALTIFLQICEGLQYAHSRGVIHKDIKPSNVMLVQEGKLSDVVKIVDFGIAEFFHQHEKQSKNVTQVGDIMGSPHYMSPEQCKSGTLDHRSDVYSFGCLMYEALTGQPPFRAQTMIEVIYKHVSEPVIKLAERAPDYVIPHALETLVLKTLEKDPKNRYQDMAHVRLDLLAAYPFDDQEMQALAHSDDRVVKFSPRLTAKQARTASNQSLVKPQEEEKKPADQSASNHHSNGTQSGGNRL
jgi:serine/threonine protein kinase/DNA-binding NarL/FixJ family response regulator